MPRKLVYLALLLMVVSLLNCSLTKSFTFTITRTFVVNENVSSFQETDKVDATEISSDFEEWKEYLESVTIESATYNVTNHTGSSSQTVNTATLFCADANGGGKTILTQVNGINLASSIGQTRSLTMNQAGLDKLESVLKKSPYTSTFYWEGTLSEAPAKFTVVFTLNCKVTYKASLF